MRDGKIEEMKVKKSDGDPKKIMKERKVAKEVVERECIVIRNLCSR